jgi:hypothetical protein
MTNVVPISANEFIEQQLNERLTALEQEFRSDALCFVGPLTYGIDDVIRNVVEELQLRPDHRDRLAVLVTTGGGFIEVVARIVDLFRRYYPHVSFIIPNYAFSAGTVLAMSGDEIYMDYYSRLGPIDPQIDTPRGPRVPALGYLKQWERLIEKANDGTLTTAEMHLMINGFDQAELYMYEQARELSITLLKEWLVTYKFKNWDRTETRNKKVTPRMKKQRAEAIAKGLNDTDRWHSHGYGISRVVLQKELNLKIDDLEVDPIRYETVRNYHGLLSDYMGRVRTDIVLHTVGKFRPL